MTILDKNEKPVQEEKPAFDPGAPAGQIVVQIGLTPKGFAMMQKLMDAKAMPEPGLIATRGFLAELSRIYEQQFGSDLDDVEEIESEFNKFKEAQEAEHRKAILAHPGGPMPGGPLPGGPMPPPPIIGGGR